MKLKDLFEMPEYIDSDLNLDGIEQHNQQFSLEEFNRDFTVLVNRSVGGNNIVIGMAKDRSKAIAGYIKNDVVISQCVLEFHPASDLGEAGNGLQVDVVQAKDDARGTGFGYELYKTLLDAGYTLVSDHTQYRGGKALWMKVLRRAAADGHYVMILKDGKFMRDASGQIIKYDGTNIPDDQIWGKKGSVPHFNTLLVARNN